MQYILVKNCHNEPKAKYFEQTVIAKHPLEILIRRLLECQRRAGSCSGSRDLTQMRIVKLMFEIFPA